MVEDLSKAAEEYLERCERLASADGLGELVEQADNAKKLLKDFCHPRRSLIGAAEAMVFCGRLSAGWPLQMLEVSQLALESRLDHSFPATKLQGRKGNPRGRSINIPPHHLLVRPCQEV